MRPENPTLALFTVVGLMATAASAQVVRQEVPGIRNFAKVESTVACAGAITPAAIQEIKKMGYASIINLRLATEEGADIDGNIWCGTGFGGEGVDGVHVYAPDGKKIGQIVMPEGTANLCFVGRNRNRLFMTSSQSVYTLYTGAQGAHNT